MTPTSSGNIGRHFVAEERAYFLFAGLVPLGKPDVARMVQREARGKRVQNHKIKSEQSFIDGVIMVGVAALAGVFAGGLASSTGGGSSTSSLLSSGLALVLPQLRTITVEGDLVNDGPARREPEPEN